MTREELAAALRKADAAGNADDARRLAGAIRQLDAGPAVQAPARPAMDPLHMVNPAARAQVQANQPMRSLPMSPLGPGNERYAPPKPPPQGDPLAPANPQAAAANVDAQQRARGLVPYTNASTGETYWRPDPARQVADANAQFRAREAAKASAAQAQAENEAFRNSRPEIVNQASDAIRGGFAATENAAFDVVDAGLDAVDPRRKVSQFISQNVTPAAEQVGRGIGDFVEGPSGRFGGMAGPAVGAITGGLSELGATMARDPQDASTQIVDALEPTHMLARGVNTSGDALDAAMGGDFGRSGNLMAQAVPDLIGGSGVLPAMSVTANALRTAARAPQRELAEQLARIQPLPATGRVPMSAPRVAPTVAQTAQQAPTQPQTVTAPPVPPIPPNAPAVTAGAAQPVPARSRAEQRADDLLIKKLAADGITMDDVRKIQARLARRGDSGVYETIGEIAALTDKSSGANLRGLQMAGGAAPGPLQEALVGLVNQNTEKLSPRLSRGATRATGQKADNAVATLDELETRLRTEATPAYDDAYATPVNPQVFANEILPVLNTPSGQKALQAARNNLASIAADLQGRAARGASERAMMESQRAQAAVKSIDDFMADPVLGTAIPTTMALDYTKRAFDDVIADAGFGSDTARIVGGTKRNFADSVSQATGGQYGNALGVFEDVKRLEDAFEVGTQALNKKTWELERELAKGRGGSPWTAGEVEALAMGVARNIEDLIEANNQSALTKLLKDKALKNMATALGSQKAADMFEETIRRLGANREWGRRVAGGSDTAMRQAAIRDAGMEGEDAVTRVLDRVETSGNQFSLPGLVNDVAVKPIARTAKDIYQRLRYPGVYDEEVNRALIPLIGKPMTEGNLNEVIRRVEARMAEKGLIPPAQPAAVAAPPPAPRRRPRGPRGNPPGTTSSASATGTGIVAGSVLGAMAPADDENEQFINALFTAAGVGTVAGVASKFSKGGKPPPANGKGAKPKAPPAKAPAASLQNAEKILADFRVARELSDEQLTPVADAINTEMRRLQTKTVEVNGERIPYSNTSEGYDRVMRLNGLLMNAFKDASGEIDIAKAMRWAEKNDPDRAMRVEAGRAVNDLEDGVRPSKPRSGPPGVKPPPVKMGFGGSRDLPMDEGSRMERARSMGFDVDRVAYRGLGRAYDESGKGGGRRYQMFTSSQSDAAEYGSNVVEAYLRKGNNLQLDGGGRNFNSVSVSQLPEDVRAKLHPSIQGVARIDDIADAAQKAGYDSVTVANVFDNAWGEVPTKPRPRTQKDIDFDNELLRELGVDPADMPSAPRVQSTPKKNTDPVTIDVIFDTKNIRSKDAKFDPSQEQSSKLLAGMSGNSRGIADNLKQDAALAAFGSVGGSFANQDDPQAGALAGMGLALGGKYGPRLANAMRGAGRVKPPPVRGAAQGKFRGPNNQTFAGVNAKTADKVALARAQNMEAEGAGRDAIWDETGWFKGVDGKWRFEIDDSGAKIGSEAALVFNGGRPYPSTMQNVMEHPELYAAYPDMATDAGMIARRNSAAGVYEPELKSATAIAPDLENARSIMLHEAGGHGVQEVEGFARGGSIESFTQQKDAQLARDAMYWRKEIAGKRKQMPQADWIAVENALIDDYKKSGIMDWLPSREARDLAHDRISNPDAQLEEIVKVYGLDRNVSVDSPREMYRRTAGEVEARNVQTRDAMRMRGDKPGRPWETQDVPDDQQIVRFASGKAESRPKPPQTGNALAGKPPKGPPGTLSRMVAGGAVGGLAGSLGGDANAQEDLTGKISQTEQTIAELKKAMADLDKITDPFEKQRFLKAQGYYAGKIDGDIAGKTTEGMERWKAKKEAELEKAEAERKDLVRRDALQSNRPDPLMMALREYGPAVLGIGALFGMKYMRGGAAKASIKTAEAASNKLNKLITKGPVTGAMNKRDENRFANLNKLWQKGGASKEELPFKQDGAGKYKPNAKAKLPEELFADSGVWQTVTKYVKGKDVAIILGGGLDVAIAQPFIDKANENLSKAEAAWNDTPSDETAKALEDAKNEVAAYTLLQRIGMGVAAGRILGTFGGAYAKPMPNIPAAASEQAKLKQFIVSQKPPPKPRAKANPPAPKPRPKPRPKPPAPPAVPPTSQLPLPLKGGGKKKP